MTGHEKYKTTEGSLEAKLPTTWTDGKAEVGRVREESEEKRREDQRRERVRKKKLREKVEKSQFIVVSNDLWFRRVEK